MPDSNKSDTEATPVSTKTAETLDAPATREAPRIDAEGNLTNPSDAGKNEHGAQVVLTGAARAAARGGLHGSIEENTMARDAAVGRGEAADGTTPDGSTPDGRLPPDVATGADQHRYGPAGQGEGKPGARPGDERVAEAQREAEEMRRKAREEAERAAKDATQRP